MNLTHSSLHNDEWVKFMSWFSLSRDEWVKFMA